MSLIEIGRTRSGQWIRGIAGEALSNRDLVYISSDETWKKADASSSTTMPVKGIALSEVETGESIDILISGSVQHTAWNWTPGTTLYASTTSGEITNVAPPGVDDHIQIIGEAYRANLIVFDPHIARSNSGAAYTKTENIPADELGKPAANNPTVVDQANLTLYSFTVNTDFMTYKLTVPSDYASGGLKFNVVWTNDGGVDDLNKNVRAQFDYQIGAEGDSVDGSHANSPKNVNDSYTSAAGWIEHHSDYVTIAESDFTGKECVYVKVSFVTASATVLTCNPHLIGVCLQYEAYAYG
jgi:hypothetical protein